MQRLILAMLAFLALSAQPAFAACGDNSGDRGVALLVGVSQYSGTAGTTASATASGWTPLPNAVRDIEMVCQSLSDAGYATIVLRDPDWGTFDAAIADFHLAALDAQSAIVYFAGHGFQYQGTQYLVPASAPVNSPPEAMRANFVPMDRLLEAASSAQDFTLIMLDACRVEMPDLTVSGGGGSRPPASIGLFEVPGGAVVFSTSSNRPAYDDAPVGSPASPFAAAVAENLGTPGLEFSDFYTNLYHDVKSRTEGMLPAGAQQTSFYMSEPRRFYLVEAPDEEELAAAQASADVAAARSALPPMEDIAVTDGRVLISQLLTDLPLPDILAAASDGDAIAQYLAGLAYQHGVGIDINVDTALQWFERSSAQQNVAGMTSLAYLLANGPHADKPRALSLFRAASDAGYAKAQSQLAFSLLSGSLGVEDRAAAIDLFRQASNAGHVYATYAVGQYGDRAQDRAWAEQRLAELAAQGEVEGDNWLCEMHYVDLDFDDIAENCERAALAGYPAARAIWAGMLARGDGVRRDDDEAEYWARLALTQLQPRDDAARALIDYTRRLVD